jgi:hypothetical protein
MFAKPQEFPSSDLNKQVDIISIQQIKGGKGTHSNKEERFPPAQEIAPPCPLVPLSPCPLVPLVPLVPAVPLSPCPPISPFNQHLLLFFNKWVFLYFDER